MVVWCWRLSWVKQSLNDRISILGEVRKRVIKTTTLGFQTADFGLFRMLVERVPWETVLKDREGGPGGLDTFRGICKTQEQAVPMC